MADNVIQTRELVKEYKGVRALDGLNLRVPRGVLAGFIGLNGAGKTTTMRLLLQIARATSGEAEVLGLNALSRTESIEIRRRLAFVPERKDMFPYMRVVEAVAFTKSFYPKWRADREREYMAGFGLRYDQKIPQLSKGALTKLHLLLALCRGAELILLDEPTDGLDPLGVEIVMQALVSLTADGGTVLFSSHRLNEIEQVADHLSMIHQGRVLLDGSLDDLRAACRRVVMVFPDEAKAFAPEFAKSGPVRVNGRTLTVVANGDVAAVAGRGEQLGAKSVDVEPLALRDLFLELVKGASV